MGVILEIGAPHSGVRPAPPPLPSFKAAPDGISLYMPRSPDEWDYLIEIGRVLERIGIDTADFSQQLVGRNREWIMLRFSNSDQATAFRVGTSLPLRTSVP